MDKLKKVEYMQKYLGEAFTGVISGVTSWGFFVELDNTVRAKKRRITVRLAVRQCGDLS